MKYKIEGEPMSVVICELEAGERMITESGSMAWMSPNMQMQTSGGGIGKMFGRMFSGENLFQNIYTAQGGAGMIAFAASFPGSVVAMEITPDKPIIVQKSALLAATDGVELSVFFQKKAMAGLFGGEGFIMQKISGSGIAFIELDGHAVEYQLGAGEQILVDTGNTAVIDYTCTIDVQTVKGVKNALFGGEGLFLTSVTGPGKVILQTMPMSAFASTILPYLPQSGNK